MLAGHTGLLASLQAPPDTSHLKLAGNTAESVCLYGDERKNDDEQQLEPKFDACISARFARNPPKIFDAQRKHSPLVADR